MSPWHSRPRSWVIGAAACAVMVCGAIWPAPVVGALGALVAAWALVHGIRLAFTEQPAARRDPSGPDPETARTGPDTTGQQHADQAGHDLDALRTRIAAAIRTAAHDCDSSDAADASATSCQLQHPVQVGAWHHGQVSDVYGPVDAIADAVLAELAPELERPRLASPAAAEPDDFGTSAWILRAVNEYQASHTTPGTTEGSSR